MALQGSSDAGTNGTAGDQVSFHTGSHVYSVSSSSQLGLLGQWASADFNIFGDGCSSNVDVTGGVMGTRLEIVGQASPSSAAAPVPFKGGTTAETNNMNVVSGSVCPQTVGPSVPFPAVEFLQYSPDRSQPAAPFCLLNSITPINAPLY
jgi:hypothetical protein